MYTWKKQAVLLLLILALLLAVSTACGTEEGGESAPASDSVASETEESSKSDVSVAEASSVVTESADTSSEDVSDTESSEPDESSDPGDESSGTEEPNEEPVAFRLSSMDDVTDGEGVRTYTVYAPYTDSYTIEGNGTEKITLERDGKTLSSGKTKLTVSLKANAVYTLTVKTPKASADFTLTTVAKTHAVTLPYEVVNPIKETQFDVNGSDPLVAAEAKYVKRKGGTYIYSNNPEAIASQHVGKAFMRNDGLTGDVYVTFEHANYTGKNIYLGYQLKNNTDHDVYVTVTNVGYQWIGTWFGQLAWYDFYNTSFALPSDYFTASGSISSKYSGLDYAYRKYEPRVYQPTTYRLPAGEYFWVIGGTSADAYRNIDVDHSANHVINNVRCANGNVKFTVTGGEVSGTMYCYTDASSVKAEPAPLGYVAANYAHQYSGIAFHHGVIDNSMAWTFGDDVTPRMLPVTYTNYYADSVPSKTSPYAPYNSTSHTQNGTSWMTHLNPQNSHQAVGTDMVEFLWHDGMGKKVLIDNDHADGSGSPANTGNWMIEYQDHFTFVNQGNTDRVIRLHLRDHGTLATLVRDSKTGKVLETAFTAGLGEASGVFSNFTYDLTVKAHSVQQITLDYLLVACSYGSVVHAVELLQ